MCILTGPLKLLFLTSLLLLTVKDTHLITPLVSNTLDYNVKKYCNHPIILVVILITCTFCKYQTITTCII